MHRRQAGPALCAAEDGELQAGGRGREEGECLCALCAISLDTLIIFDKCSGNWILNDSEQNTMLSRCCTGDLELGRRHRQVCDCWLMHVPHSYSEANVISTGDTVLPVTL